MIMSHSYFEVIKWEDIECFVKSHSDAPFIAYVQIGNDRFLITTDRNGLCLGFKDVVIIKDTENYGKSINRKN